MLPGGKEIRSGELRGVMSEGMLCSLKELGLTLNDFPYAQEDGIFILQEDCKPGDDIRTVLGLDDHVVEFEITNNRPDCLSVIGLAREAAATFGRQLSLHVPEVKGAGGSILELLDIEIEAPDLAPRLYRPHGEERKIEPSPRWMRERLRASGVRPINKHRGHHELRDARIRAAHARL
jgi:phenylalanyl-tRNA synthetase beta chain